MELPDVSVIMFEATYEGPSEKAPGRVAVFGSLAATALEKARKREGEYSGYGKLIKLRALVRNNQTHRRSWVDLPVDD